MVEIIDPDYCPKLTLAEGAREYSQFRQVLRKEGLLKRSYGYYGFLSLSLLLSYMAIIYAVFISSGYLELAFFSVLFSCVVVQVLGLMHDAGHHAIFKSRRMNIIFCRIFGFLGGINAKAWIIKHNRHHEHPNQIGVDEDVDVPFAFTSERYFEFNGMMKILRPYQSWLYFPMTLLTGYSMHIGLNILYLMKIKNKERPSMWIVECFISVLALSFWYVIPFLLLDFTKAMILINVATCTGGFYLANVFAPNHKGMPQLSKDARISNLEQQIITSRNIQAGTLNDFVYIGLNYQIEHHLVPNCPRNKLKRVNHHLRALCERTNLPYTEVSVIESYRIILKELADIAHQCENQKNHKPAAVE